MMYYSPPRPGAPKAVGAYIFAGGFTIGVSHFFNVVAHLEESNYGVRTAQRNFPNVDIYVKPERWPLLRLHEQHDVDLLYCNPPCALFSTAGATMRGGHDAWKRDPRQACWKNCFVAFEALQPKIFAIESVVRAYTAGREFIDMFVELATALGYSTTHLLCDAQWLGLPQRRKRYFMIFHKVDIDFEPNHQRRRTINEVLKLVKKPGPSLRVKDPIHQALIPQVKPGTNMRPLWEAMVPESERKLDAYGRTIGRPRMFVHRMNGDGVMGTLAGDYFIHPTEDRFLGVNEMKVLNGYPEDYWLEGHRDSHASFLARGVTPAVAYWLASHFRRAIDRNQPCAEVTQREIDFRTPSPEILEESCIVCP